jgi:hypothetical protein
VSTAAQVDRARLSNIPTPQPKRQRYKLVGKSTQFPREPIGVYASSLTPIPPRLLYQRRNIRGSQLKVTDLCNYRGKRILGLIHQSATAFKKT